MVETKPDGPPVVQAVNYPLAYFAERLAGDWVDIQFLAEGKGDPAFWEPTDEDLIAMQSADLILLNGASYDKWIETVSLPTSILVDTSRAFAGEYLEDGQGIAHSHGPGQEAHTHGSIAFTTWMDLQQAIWQAEEVAAALTDLLPEKEAKLAQNLDTLAIEIEEVHEQFQQIGKGLGDRPFLASHPVYQYFARRYGLNIESLHWEPQVVPDAEAIEKLKQKLIDHPAEWMIWEGEPLPESIEKLKDLGISSLVVNPCGNQPEEGDWLSVMQANVAELRRATQ